MDESSSVSSINVTQNPFELDSESLDSLHLPQCSPSVFAIKQRATPASSKKTPKFRWSIDQMAILHPVEIEELPYHQQDSTLDSETEEKVQAAIDKFFSQQQVVPSPWSEPKPAHRLPFTPKLIATPNPAPTTGKSNEASVNTADAAAPVQKPKTVNATCQTMLSLPMDFDLAALLGGDHYKCKDDKSDYEIMSTSSLRRKLFSCDTTPPISPVKSGSAPFDSSRESMPFIISSPPISPIRVVEDIEPELPVPDISVIKTPGSEKSQFSSSPITSKMTPLYFSRMSGLSSEPSDMESPSMSPIRRSHIASPLSSTSSDPKSYTKSNCAGAFLPDDTSISMSIVEESPVRPVNKNSTRTNHYVHFCPSPCPTRQASKTTSDDSLDTWSKDDLCVHDDDNPLLPKLTSTMKLPEPMDSVGITFEPRLCSSRLLVTSTHQENSSQLHVSSSSSSEVGNSESLSTASGGDKLQYQQQQQQQQQLGVNVCGGFNETGSSQYCSSTLDALKERQDYRGPTKAPSVIIAPPHFGYRPKAAAAGVEMNGGNSDSGFNTYSISSFEPTDMEIIEER